MSTDDSFRSAIGAQLLSAAGARRELLTSIVAVARQIFRARASSISLLDEEAGELIFEATDGEGAERLVGTRFPATAGVAGYVLQSAEPIVLDDVSRDPRFARDVAERTGYIPTAIMAVPLLRDERTLGVLTVLDRGNANRSTLAEVELLSAFGAQAAIALDLTTAAHRSQALMTDEGDDEMRLVAELATRLDALGGERRAAGVRLLEALLEVLPEKPD